MTEKPTGWKNKVYFGDNLQILREHILDESVDLIYLDPPFNSQATYNVLFGEKNGTQSQAQITAFDDTWHWGEESEQTYREVVTEGPKKLADLVQALRSFLGQNDMMAYLVMMAIRLAELHRVLKSTGSIYLHCDPTASHYLKLLMDAVFDPTNFRNEITWKRSSAHSDTKQGMQRFGRICDTLLFYTKATAYTYNPQFTAYTPEYLKNEYRHATPEGRFYKETDLSAAKPGGDTEYDWYVKRPIGAKIRWQPDITEEFRDPRQDWEYRSVRPYNGRYWAFSRANLIEFARVGRLAHRGTGMPRLMHFADEMPGIPLQDLWLDIPPTRGNQDLGYPTQKPEALLERIIKAGSNEHDLILDPFCGCGTAINVAERLGRRWTGIDITHLAIALIKNRLQDTFGPELSPYEIIGAPKDLSSAKALAAQDRYQFEWWALSLVGARPAQDKKKGADSGIDGYINFFDDGSGKAKKIVVQVKSGHVTVSQIRDLKAVVEREKAVIGVFISFEEFSKPMKQEALSAGYYAPEHLQKEHTAPKIQTVTIAELLAGVEIRYPRLLVTTFKRAQRKYKETGPIQEELL